jgi:hypothetical protein
MLQHSTESGIYIEDGQACPFVHLFPDHPPHSQTHTHAHTRDAILPRPFPTRGLGGFCFSAGAGGVRHQQRVLEARTATPQACTTLAGEACWYHCHNLVVSVITSPQSDLEIWTRSVSDDLTRYRTGTFGLVYETSTLTESSTLTNGIYQIIDVSTALRHSLEQSAVSPACTDLRSLAAACKSP